MLYKDLHSTAFSISTITKLEIFEDYAKAWLPTFVQQDYSKEIHVFDFFSGPGYDVGGMLGSPIRLFKTVVDYEEQILGKNKRIVLHFNEFEPHMYIPLILTSNPVMLTTPQGLFCNDLQELVEQK